MRAMLFEVIKRDGRIEAFNPQKIDKIVSICSEGLNIDINKFRDKLTMYLKPRMTTSEIQKNLITAAVSLVSTEDNKDDYSRFAARLMLVDFRKNIRIIRKNLFPDSKISIRGHFQKFKDYWVKYLNEYLIDTLGICDNRFKKIHYRVVREIYNELILDKVEKEDILWNNATHIQVQKLINSYILTYDNKPIETIEEMWLLQSMLAFLPSVYKYNANWEDYKEKVYEHFKYLSEFVIIPATPQLLNLRRAKPNLSSCFILDVNDNTESIVHTQSQIAQISRNAGGVGLYIGKLRPSGSWIKGNPGLSNKISDWVKLFETTVYNWNQMGKRKGAITIALPIWHKDIIDFLQSIDTDIGNPARKSPEIFPQVVIPNFFFKYINQKKPFYLIDLHEITVILGREDLDLHNYVGDELEQKYNEIVSLIEQGKIKNYIKIDPKQLLQKIFYYWSRKGLPYISFYDNINEFSPYDNKKYKNTIIYSANLCVENLSPFRNTNPRDLYCIKDEEIGYIHTCNITNLNLRLMYERGYLPLYNDEGKNRAAVEKLKKLILHLYEYMDNLLDIQEIPVKESQKHNELFRTVSAGFIGLADVFVKYSIDNNTYVGYTPTRRKKDINETLKVVEKIFGTIAFMAVLASSELAKKRGAAPFYTKTKTYTQKLLLGRYHLYNDANFIKSFIGDENYEKLVDNIENFGLRNTLLLTCPPCLLYTSPSPRD